MRLQPLILTFLLLAVSFAAVRADSVDLAITPVNNAINWDGTATYLVKVMNNQGMPDTFRLRPSSFMWGTLTFDDPVVAVTAGGTTQTKAHFSPPRDVVMSGYAVEMLALSNSNSDIRASALLKLDVLNELPHVQPEWGVPTQIQPGQTEVNLIVKDTGNLPVSGVTAILSSDLLKDSVTIPIDSLQKGEARLVWDTILDIPLNTPSQAYNFKFVTYKDNAMINEYVLPVTVVAKPSVDINVEEKNGFLATTYEASVTNVGNTLADDAFTAEMPSWQRVFLVSKESPDLATGAIAGTVDASWGYTLVPGESALIVYQISYIPLLAMILAFLVLLYAGSWAFKEELSLTKETVSLNNALKVNLSVKNTSRKPVHNVIIEDNVPTPMKLVPGFEVHKPIAVKKGNGVVKILWRFDTLWPGEEKILSYSMKTALGVVGTVMLPPARGKRRAIITGEKPKIYLSNSVAVRANIATQKDNFEE
jgi:hypothetical protein